MQFNSLKNSYYNNHVFSSIPFSFKDQIFGLLAAIYIYPHDYFSKNV